MPKIVLENIVKRYDRFYAVDDLNLVIEDNAFVTLLGPSGCGKTTTLRMIAGLETPTTGKITIGDRVVFDSEEGINVPANKRKVGFLFQNYALWPNMTVYENISFGLTNINEEQPVISDKCRALTQMIKALERPQDLVTTVKDCYDKKGKLDDKKALIKVIDRFEVSKFTAKTLIDLKLHETADFASKGAMKLAELKKELEAEVSSIKSKGYELSEDYTYLKDGKVFQQKRRLSKEEIDLAVRRVSRIVKIGMFMDRYPAELSGGQQQRVAIARTLAPEPTVLFMDEPLSNLDAKLRLEMRSELQRLHLETGSTFVYVTHDQMEAMTLATKICLIDNGVLQQYDAPLDVYNRPNNLFVADFVGNPAINFIDAKLESKGDSLTFKAFGDEKLTFTPNDKLDVDVWREELRNSIAAEKAKEAEKLSKKGAVEKSNKETNFKYHVSMVNEVEDFGDEVEITDEDYVIGIRPEFVEIGKEGKQGKIYSSMPTGMESTLRVAVGDYLLTSVMFGGVIYQLNEICNVNFKGNNAVLFDRKSGRVIALGSLSWAK